MKMNVNNTGKVSTVGCVVSVVFIGLVTLPDAVFMPVLTTDFDVKQRETGRLLPAYMEQSRPGADEEEVRGVRRESDFFFFFNFPSDKVLHCCKAINVDSVSQ